MNSSIPWYIIIQRYSDATDLFNYVDIVGPFNTANEADNHLIHLQMSPYFHYTITTPSPPGKKENANQTASNGTNRY
jgi:hypothetical protein